MVAYIEIIFHELVFDDALPLLPVNLFEDDLPYFEFLVFLLA
jgi:hypothetical protein